MSTVLDGADRAQARYSAARGELLAAVAELDRTGEWRGHGAGTLASFLCARWQISLKTARELVREAKELSCRPALQKALCESAVSIDQAKALTALSRVGTDDEEVWLETLWSWSIEELEREARMARARELERKDDGVYFRAAHTPDERYVRGEFQLHPEEGAQVIEAIEARVPKGTRLSDWDQASARALVELAKDSVGSGGGGGCKKGAGRADVPLVLLSVTEETLRRMHGADGIASVGSVGFVGAETARRLFCDSRIQALVRGEGGRVLESSRTSRVVPAHLRRVVLERDGWRCTFLGCGNARYLEMHHVVHVADGGPTELWNLLTTCWVHHKLAHEGGWSLRGEAGPKITWIRPDGTPFEPRVRVTLDTC